MPNNEPKLNAVLIKNYIKTDENSNNLYKIDKYWLEKLILATKKMNLSEEGQIKFKNIQGTDLVNKLELLASEKLLTKKELDDLYLEKQENSRKVIRIYKLHKNTHNRLENIKKKISEKYNSTEYDHFDKYNLMKNIEKRASASSPSLKLIYINELDPNHFNIVFNYRIKWVEANAQGSFDTKHDFTTAVLNIDATNNLFQIRIGKHRGFGKKEQVNASINTMEDAFNKIKNELLSLINASEDDLTIGSIRQNVKTLFNNKILTKYEGIHKHTENNTEIQVHFTITKSTGKIDYADLDIYTKIRKLNLDNSILLIRGSWNMEEKEIKENFIQPEKITFDVRTNEIITLSSYTRKEMNYALSYITKNI